MCLSTGGCLPPCTLGYTPRDQTPPRTRGRHPPDQSLPRDQTPPGSKHPPPQGQTPDVTSGLYASYWNAYLLLSVKMCTTDLVTLFSQNLYYPMDKYIWIITLGVISVAKSGGRIILNFSI